MRIIIPFLLFLMLFTACNDSKDDTDSNDNSTVAPTQTVAQANSTPNVPIITPISGTTVEGSGGTSSVQVTGLENFVTVSGKMTLYEQDNIYRFELFAPIPEGEDEPVGSITILLNPDDVVSGQTVQDSGTIDTPQASYTLSTDSITITIAEIGEVFSGTIFYTTTQSGQESTVTGAFSVPVEVVP